MSNPIHEEKEMIDPIEFGRMQENLKNLSSEVHLLRGQMAELLELANKSRGGFWVGMAVASFAGGLVTFVIQRVLGKFIV